MSDVTVQEVERLGALLQYGLAGAKHRPSLQRTKADPPRNDAATRAEAAVILDRFFADMTQDPLDLMFPIYAGPDGFRIDLVSTLEVAGLGGQAFRVSGPPDVMDRLIAELKADEVGFRRLGDPAPDHVG